MGLVSDNNLGEFSVVLNVSTVYFSLTYHPIILIMCTFNLL